MVGPFDETFDACEDVEFNHRLDRAGLRCYFTPRLAIGYQPRSTLGGLVRQLVRYGRGRVRLLKKHPDTLSLSTMVPLVFVVGLIAGPLACVMATRLTAVYVGTLIVYAAIVLTVTVRIAFRQSDARLLWRLPLVFATVHLASGTGMLLELSRWSPRLEPAHKQVSPFAPRKNASFAARKATLEAIPMLNTRAEYRLPEPIAAEIASTGSQVGTAKGITGGFSHPSPCPLPVGERVQRTVIPFAVLGGGVRGAHVVIVNEELPYPANSGKRIRTWNLTVRLAHRHRITYVAHREADPMETRRAVGHLASRAGSSRCWWIGRCRPSPGPCSMAACSGTSAPRCPTPLRRTTARRCGGPSGGTPSRTRWICGSANGRRTPRACGAPFRAAGSP